MLKLLRYLRYTWWQLLVSIMFVTLQSYFQLELPKQMGLMTNMVINGAETSDVLLKGGYMGIVSIIVVICAVGGALLNSYIASTFGKNVRADIFKKVTTLSLTEYEKFGTASLMTRTTNDVQQIQMALFMGIRIMIMSPIIFTIAISNTLRSNAVLTLVFAAAIPLIVIVLLIPFVVAYPLFDKIQKKIDRATLVLRENLTGIRVIRAFNQQRSEARRYDVANRDMTNITMKVGRTMSFINPGINIIFNITYLAIYFLGFASLDGQLATDPTNFVNFGSIMATAQYSINVMNSLVMFALIFILLPRARASANRINAVLDTNPTISDPAQPVTTTTGKGKIEFRNVTFQFKDADSPTLQNINFVSKPGQVTAIIGSTGSGKSSIINLIPRFYDVTEGQVLIDDVDVRDFSQKDLREKIGFVPQQALLFSGSVADNLRYGRQNADEALMWEALNVAQAAKFVGRKEEKLEFDVSQGGKNFSGGQKQRISIARALIKKPEIYIFDDAFSALDFKTDIKLRQALKSYVKQATVIIVAQRVSTIIDSDNILVLHEGKIVAQGKHEALLHKCKIYREIVYSQLDPEEIDKTLALSQQVLATNEGAD
ncbi:MAG TPA: multidrug ABC transporter ATP-binding protein [Firmicutes bacterium]|nr:multidrug ABC transporter ATP-binding protein [Bacillota bacterium]